MILRNSAFDSITNLVFAATRMLNSRPGVVSRIRPATDTAVGMIGHGGLTLDPEAWVARWQGEEIALTVTEFTILRTLASMPSRIFSRDMIIDRLHGPGFAITDRTIDSHIRNLRRKFAEAGCEDLIETRAGVGYRLGSCTERSQTA